MKRVPFIDNETINDKAEDLRLRTGQEDAVPVDVEHIIEAHLDLRIVPIPNLLSNFDIDGFISHDFSKISIDEGIYFHRETRARFTLGHEVGHYVLHRDLLLEAAGESGVRTEQSWIEFHRSMLDADRSRLEQQGYVFSGMLLVPTAPMSMMFDEAIPYIEEQISEAKSRGFERSSYLDSVLDSIAGPIAARFEVSLPVVVKRLLNSGLAARIH